MEDKLVNDRIRLIRYGDENSATNRKAREAAFKIAATICEAFSPNYSQGGTGSIWLPHDYSIKLERQLVKHAQYPGISLTGKGNFGFPIYWTCSEETHPDDRMLSLTSTRYLAECIAGGWLPRVVEELETNRGASAAIELAKKLWLHPHLRM
jgi:hypothetical protein